MGRPPRRILILFIGSLYFLMGCAQIQQVKEGFVDGWEETKKAVGAGKDSKTSKKAKPADSGDKAKETPAPQAVAESKDKKPVDPPSGLFGPK